MKRIAKALAIIGALCLMSAAGNDEMANAAGGCYSMTALVAWTIGGFLCIGAAWMIYERREG